MMKLKSKLLLLPNPEIESSLVDASTQTTNIKQSISTVMSKHAPTPHHRDGPDSKKKKLENVPGHNLLPTDGEMKKMSVREKLLAGVSSSFARQQQEQQQQHHHQQQQKRAHNQPSYAPVASLQKAIDEAFHMNPGIGQSLNEAAEPGVMLPGEVDERLWAKDLDQRRQILTDHFHLRMNQRRDTSRRLQAVLRLANDNPFAPAGASNGQGPENRLRLFLQSACRKYGYRKLQIDLCGFMTIKAHSDLKGEPLGSVPREPTVKPVENVTLDANRGSITLYESNVPDQFGRTTTWTWLKICSHLAAYEPNHHLAPDVSKEEEEGEDEAWVIIAIPKSQIETLEDDWSFYPALEKQTYGDYIMGMSIPYGTRQDAKNFERRRSLAFRYSRDGVPSIASSKKSGDDDSMWFGFRTDVDEMQWERIQEAMERNSCLVHALSEIDAEWIHVAPEQPKKIEQPGKSTEARTPRQTKRLRGMRKSSNLKNEIRLEDC